MNEVSELFKMIQQWIIDNWEVITVFFGTAVASIGSIITIYMQVKKFLPTKEETVSQEQYNALMAKLDTVQQYQEVTAREKLENPTISDEVKSQYGGLLTESTALKDNFDTVKEEINKYLG